MWGTGADRPVVAMKALQWGWSDGGGSSWLAWAVNRGDAG